MSSSELEFLYPHPEKDSYSPADRRIRELVEYGILPAELQGLSSDHQAAVLRLVNDVVRDFLVLVETKKETIRVEALAEVEDQKKTLDEERVLHNEEKGEVLKELAAGLKELGISSEDGRDVQTIEEALRLIIRELKVLAQMRRAVGVLLASQ